MAKRRGVRFTAIALAHAERTRVEKNARARARRAEKKREDEERKKKYEEGYAKREKRREEERERRERMRAMKEALLPKMKKIVERFELGGTAFQDTRAAHANWYEEKIAWGVAMGESEYEAVLEAISDELDLDELGWDIVY